MRKIHKNVPMLFEPRPWEVVEKEFSQDTNSINETIFCIGNGYIGIRGFFEEGFYGIPMHTMRTTMINGIYEYFPYNHIWCRPGFPKRYHAILNQTDPLDLKIKIDGEYLILGEQVTNYSRTLNMRTGEVIRKFTYTTKRNKKVDLIFQRFCSQVDRHEAFMKLIIETNDIVNIELISSLASIVQKSEESKEEIGGSTGETYKFREVKRENNLMIVGYDTVTSGFEVTCGISEKINQKGVDTNNDTVDSLSTSHIYNQFTGKLSYERCIIYTTNREFKNHLEVARNKLLIYEDRGYDLELKSTILE